MDKLEEFILSNKDGLEKERKEDEGWERLERKLNSRDRTLDRMVYWKVAAVVFLISTIALAVVKFPQSTGSDQVSGFDDGIENYYAKQINLKVNEYVGMAEEREAEDLLRDLEKMDAAYLELKKSFSENENEEVADAMLENLRLRILILNEQIHLIRYGKSEEEAYHSS